MPATREKTISYRRAVWFTLDKKGRDLEKLTNAAYAKLLTVAQRKFSRADGQVIKGIWHKAEPKGGCFVHIAAETPGDQASTLAQSAEAKDSQEVETAPPPTGQEYMDGDIILLIKGNDVCVCATGLKEGVVTTYFHQFFSEAGLGDEATKFELQKVASVSKLKIINAEGVKEIDLSATLDEATTKYLNRKTAVGGAMGEIGKHLKAVFRKDNVAVSDNVRVGIVLKTDGRVKKGQTVGARRMADAAKELVRGEDDSGYVIVTKSGQRISPDEVFIRERVTIKRHGKTVDRPSACSVLRKFYNQLAASGVTAQ